MIEIITHLDAWSLDLAPNTNIGIEENSKGFDANQFHFDFTSSITLPYSPTNVKLLHKYGFEKFKVIIKSDGVFIGDYYARITKNNYNLNLFTGSLTLELKSLFADLADTLSKTPKEILKKEFNYEIDAPQDHEFDEGETASFYWFQRIQKGIINDMPFRLPYYFLCKSYYDENKTFNEPKYEDTLKKDFGNWVAVNELSGNDYSEYPWIQQSSTAFPSLGTVPDSYDVKYNILFDRVTYDLPEALEQFEESPAIFEPSHVNFVSTFPNEIMPRRIWGLVCPCFRLTDAIAWILEGVGLKTQFDFKSEDEAAFFNNIYILNNHNIFNPQITRVEGSVYEWLPSWGLPTESHPNRTNWVGSWPSYTAPPAIAEEYNIEIIVANHIPDVPCIDIITDFLIKSNMYPELEGNKMVFKSYVIAQDKSKRTFNPNITKEATEYIKNKILSYVYIDEEITENITDFNFNIKTKDSEEISSILVPVYEHTKLGVSNTIAKHCFILGEPSIDKSKYLEQILLIQFGFTDPPPISVLCFGPEPHCDFPNPIIYDHKLTECPKAVGMSRRRDSYLPQILWGGYLDSFHYEEIPTQIHIDGNTLSWHESTGIFERFYRPVIDIFKIAFLYKVKEKLTIESWQKFSHYIFFSLTGKKSLPLKRKFTLPFSRNTEIEYDLYELE